MKLVYIEWEDAIAHTEQWLSTEQALKWAKYANCLVKQVGFLLEENKEYLVVCGQMYDATNFTNEHMGLIQKVPKTWIRRRINLTKYIK